MNNDKKHIESLLDLFMQGKTTLEQESELKRFFATAHDIPKEWEPYREMMAYFDNGMPIAKAPTAPQRVIIADVDTVDNSEPQVIAPPKPIIAKVEKTEPHKAASRPATIPPKQKTRSTSPHKAPIDAAEMEREQGEIELAQQELMADRFIIEQERQEILEEQYAGRVQAHRVQQAIANENPQFIQVVFK